MTLHDLITERIRTYGPISVADYMAMCLTHPEYGYYMRRDPLGASGDFTTAPEISQIFGELLGLWIASQWIKQGKPEAILLELGPGRGSLMADCLRATAKVPGFHAAISVYLLEASPVLKQKQWQQLAGKHPRLHWCEALSAIPELPIFCLANEFFDALPIHQYLDDQERNIGLDAAGNFCFLPPQPETAIITERCPAARAIIEDLAGHIHRHGGAALIVDYGYSGGSRGDSLQAVREHQFYDVLATPGEADLTAHVDFDALAAAAIAAGAYAPFPAPQGKFLLQIGASQRLMRLCSEADETQKQHLMSGFERLISHEQMGEIFKVLAVLPHPQPHVEGF